MTATAKINSVRHLLCVDDFRFLLPLREKVRMRGSYAADVKGALGTLALSRQGRGDTKEALSRES
jgi:hypothetical protein